VRSNNSPISLPPRAQPNTPSRAVDVGQSAATAEISADVTGEANCRVSDNVDLRDYWFAVLRANAILAAQGDARRQ
jgi:hypothetical protein